MLQLAIDTLIYTVGALALLTYLVPLVVQTFMPSQNLKLKYGANWALVTGASSGIGKAITEKLAGQGVNVVMVALDDHHLITALKDLRRRFPCVEFRSVGVDLGDAVNFMKPVVEATSDIQVRLVFCNAGYILPGIFHLTPLAKQMNNLNCNATSAVQLTSHFARVMAQLPIAGHAGKRGLISFTSSSAGFLPSPISALYGATKAFMTSFAAAVAAEVYIDKIDIVCVHPSPVNSNFFAAAEGINLISAFKKTAVSPMTIADTIFKSAGRFTLRDQGFFSIGCKLLLKAVDWNLIAEISPFFMQSNADFLKLRSAVKEQ